MQKKILIIDDDYSLRTVMLKALRTSKITIKTASTISEGWYLLEKEDFDLVICDVILPDGDGLDRGVQRGAQEGGDAAAEAGGAGEGVLRDHAGEEGADADQPGEPGRASQNKVA